MIKQMNPKAKKSNGVQTCTVILALAMLMASDLALAGGGNPIQAMLDGLIGFLNSGVMRSVAIQRKHSL